MSRSKPRKSNQPAKQDEVFQDFPISFFYEYTNGIRSAKSVLATFYGSTHIDFYAKNTWTAIEKSLEIFIEADPNEEWGRIQWGNHPWQAVEVKDKWEFLEKYIKPIVEQGRPIIYQYDEITQQTFNRCDSQIKEITAAKFRGRPEDPPEKTEPHHRPATLAKAEKVAALRAQGFTQQQVAEKIGVAQSRVSDLEAVIGNKGDTIPIKSDNSPRTPSHRGTSKTHTIARLKRDGQKEPILLELAEQVESGQLTAAEARRKAGSDFFPNANRKTFTVGESTTPQAFAASLYEKLKPDFLAELVAALTDVLTTSEPEDSDHE